MKTFTQQVRCPHKRNSGHGHVHAQEAAHVRTQGEKMVICKPNREPRENQPSQHLSLTLWASRAVGNKCLWFKPPSPWHFVPTTLASHTTLFPRKLVLALRLPPTQIFTPTCNSKAGVEGD